jgi:hypothetical protein
MATAAAGAGDSDRARELAADAERIAARLSSPSSRPVRQGAESAALARVSASPLTTPIYPAREKPMLR